MAELIAELLPSGGRVLDIGGGGVRTLPALAHRGIQGVRTDLHRYGRARCQRLRAEEIGIQQEQLDLVYTLHTLHEFDTREQLAREAKEILPPAGVLLTMDWVRGAKTGVRDWLFCQLSLPVGLRADAVSREGQRRFEG